MTIRKRAPILLTLLFILFMIASFYSDLQDTLHYGGIDFRTRVVGARVVLAGKDPYFFNWRPGLPDTFIDPQVQPNAKNSRLTVTPSALMLHLPFAKYAYLNQKIIWLIFQWIAFLSTIIIFLSQSDSMGKSYLIGLLSICFAYSFFWKLHIERGQLYIFYIALLSMAWFLAKKGSHILRIFSGLIMGFTVCLRPPVALVLLPFILHRQWWIILGSAIGVVFGFILPIPWSGLSIWKSYFSSMGQIAKYLGANRVLGVSSGNSATGEIYPKIIEDLNFMALSKDIPDTNSSLQNVLMMTGLDETQHIQNIILFLFVVLSGFITWKFSSKKLPNNLLFLQGIVIYLLLEFFLPTPRYSYNDVQWLLPLLLIIISVKEIRFLINRSFILMTGSLLLCVGEFMQIPRFMIISIGLMTIYVVHTTYWLLKNPKITYHRY
jgi:Glycosyltransferase family 87